MKVFLLDKLTACLIAALLLPAGFVGAQSNEEPAPDYYRIEFIVFRYNHQQEPAYRWPGEPDTSAALDLFAPPTPDDPALGLLDDSRLHQAVFGDAAAHLDALDNTPVSGPSLVEIAHPAPIQALSDDQMTLNREWQRLERNAAYQPLIHRGWQQIAAPFEDAQAIQIHGGALLVAGQKLTPVFEFGNQSTSGIEQAAVREIDGTITFERSRYLHLKLDLALHVPITEAPISNPLAAPLRDSPDALPANQSYRSYRLLEQRQIKIGSLNYFDHRHFGVIARVEKWEPPKPGEIDPLTAADQTH